MEGSVLRNLMLYQVERINGKDLIVKAHPGHKDLIRDFGHKINCRLMHLPLCITFLL